MEVRSRLNNAHSQNGKFHSKKLFANVQTYLSAEHNTDQPLWILYDHTFPECGTQFPGDGCFCSQCFVWLYAGDGLYAVYHSDVELHLGDDMLQEGGKGERGGRGEGGERRGGRGREGGGGEKWKGGCTPIISTNLCSLSLLLSLHCYITHCRRQREWQFTSLPPSLLPSFSRPLLDCREMQTPRISRTFPATPIPLPCCSVTRINPPCICRALEAPRSDIWYIPQHWYVISLAID